MDNNHPASGSVTTGDQRPAVVEPMAPEVLEALRGSIAKWEGVVTGEIDDDGPDNCPLCEMFNNKQPYCVGCPVMAKTGKNGCRDTPYDAYSDGGRTEDAQAELDFLKSLLPESAP